ETHVPTRLTLEPQDTSAFNVLYAFSHAAFDSKFGIDDAVRLAPPATHTKTRIHIFLSTRGAHDQSSQSSQPSQPNSTNSSAPPRNNPNRSTNPSTNPAISMSTSSQSLR